MGDSWEIKQIKTNLINITNGDSDKQRANKVLLYNNMMYRVTKLKRKEKIKQFETIWFWTELWISERFPNCDKK